MSVEVKYWYLSNHKLFSALSRSAINDLCIITKYKEAEKGEIIYFADEPVQRIYFLKKGRIKIVEVNQNNEEIIKDIIQQGDLFGELTLQNSNENHEYAQAMSKEVAICSFKLEDFEAVLENNPTLALKFYKIVGYKFKRLQNRYSNLVFKDVKQRLIHFLNEWALAEGNILNNRVVLKNYLTHQDIASLICSTRQTVTQLMNELENENLVNYSRAEIVIADIRLLAKP